MIVDIFENSNKYYYLNKRFEKAFEYIKSTDFSLMQCGRYEIEGDDIYININEYNTKKETKMEFHRKYIDIQFITKGEEYIGYSPLKSITVINEYDEKNDIGFAEAGKSFVKIKKGMFMILFPEDAHQPCTAVDESICVRKVVVKVRVD